MECLAYLAAGVCLALLASACNEAQTVAPVVPSPIPAPTPTGSTLTGIVFDGSPGGPHLAGVIVQAWVWRGEVGRAGYGAGAATTDAEGRYRFLGLPAGGVVELAGWWPKGFLQPCAALVTLGGDATYDIELMSVTSVSGPVPLPSSRQASPELTGLVYEETSEGRRPIVGAALQAFTSEVFVGDNPPAASTVTGSTGRYMLCRLPGFVFVHASKAGYESSTTNEHVRTDAVFDVELKRK